MRWPGGWCRGGEAGAGGRRRAGRSDGKASAGGGGGEKAGAGAAGGPAEAAELPFLDRDGEGRQGAPSGLLWGGGAASAGRLWGGTQGAARWDAQWQRAAWGMGARGGGGASSSGGAQQRRMKCGRGFWARPLPDLGLGPLPRAQI
ncbi:glycine-rich cell wall structural protein 1.0-like [Miscanthus floridulus]|uniref:glycine-rich cell wall structural protein 1.0-like n=1 Tax=Miscanthus floridulus TaxID=154761 RepID=UPI00345AE2D4